MRVSSLLTIVGNSSSELFKSILKRDHHKVGACLIHHFALCQLV